VSAGSKTVGGAAPKGFLLSRGVLYVAAPLLAVAAISALLLGKGGGHARAVAAPSVPSVAVKPAVPTARSPVSTAGSTAPHRASPAAHAGSRAGTGAAASGGKAVAVAEVRDPEEAKSFPLPATTRHAAASTPAVAGEAAIAPGAASDAQIRKELGEEAQAKAQERAGRQRVLAPVAGGFSVGGNGKIPIPQNVPEAVQRVVAGGNAIADFPYIWGGGHASFVAGGYDCSGSVSYALAAGGLLSAPLVSGELAHWGAPGPGRWITIYANEGHTFMDVNGIWFDTAGRSGPYASRWLVSTPPLAGYAVRHPAGY
jgi:cell wall-associated NlpC family hydrolase